MADKKTSDTDVRRMIALAKDAIIVGNAIDDPTYRPYCMRCSGMVRMTKVEPFLWRHGCGAEHDERQVLAADPPPRLVPDRPSDAAIAQAFWHAWQKTMVGSSAWGLCAEAERHAREIDAAAPPAEAPASLTERLQQKCSDWGTYWRAPDAHGVILSPEQALELLRDALLVEVEIQAAEAPGERDTVERVALAIANVVGHGMAEKCEAQARAAIQALAAAPAGEVALNAEYTRGRNDGWEAAKAAPAAPAVPEFVMCRCHDDTAKRLCADRDRCLRAVAQSAPRVTGGREVES